MSQPLLLFGIQCPEAHLDAPKAGLWRGVEALVERATGGMSVANRIRISRLAGVWFIAWPFD
jgi:hypothetical protein